MQSLFMNAYHVLLLVIAVFAVFHGVEVPQQKSAFPTVIALVRGGDQREAQSGHQTTVSLYLSKWLPGHTPR